MARGTAGHRARLDREGLAYFTYRVVDADLARGVEASLQALVDAGAVVAEPIVYEDFLPRSAAGIFASNLSGAGSLDADQGGAERDLEWMSAVIGHPVAVPEDAYAAESAASVAEVGRNLGLDLGSTAVMASVRGRA